MTAYEQGFMNKCAEYGVDAGTASELLKRAGWFSWGKQNRDLGKMHDEMLRRAYAYGYDKYLPRNMRARNMPGTAVGRLWHRLLHGGSGFAEVYRGDMEKALDQARERYQQEYDRAPAEVRKIMDAEVDQRQKAWKKDQIDRARSQYGLGAAELDRQKAEADKANQPQPGQPQARQLTDDEFRRDYIAKNNLTAPNYYKTYLGTDGLWHSSDPKMQLPDEMQKLNFKLETALRDYRNGTPAQQPQQPKQEPVTPKFTPPTHKW